MKIKQNTKKQKYLFSSQKVRNQKTCSHTIWLLINQYQINIKTIKMDFWVVCEASRSPISLLFQRPKWLSYDTQMFSLYTNLMIHSKRAWKFSETPWARNVNPLQLELDFAGFDVSEPEAKVLHQFAFTPNDGALFGQAVLPARLDLCHDGSARNVAQAHLESLQERADLELGLAHFVIQRECVMVIHRLKGKQNKKHRLDILA